MQYYRELIEESCYEGLKPLSFSYEVSQPSQTCGVIVRPYWVLQYVIAGFGIYRRGGTTYQLEPGQIFVIPPYEEVYHEADKVRPFQTAWINFEIKGEPLEILQQAVITCPKVGDVFTEMMNCRSMEKGKGAFLTSCLWRVMSMLQEMDQKVYRKDYVERALSYMHSGYSQGITVKEVADNLGLERNYFSELFSERMGVSPRDYLINLRLTKAAEYMRIYGKSPSVAASSVGYDNLYHFSAIFKKHFGMSPREYKGKWK